MFKTLATTVALSLAAFGAQAATVINGSFEDTPAFNRGGYGNFIPGITGWEDTSGFGLEVQNGATIGFAAQDGNNYVELDSDANSSIQQTLFLDAGEYLLSFFYSPRVNESPTTTNNIVYSLAPELGGLSIAGGAVSNAPNTTYPYGIWTQVSSLFTVTTAGNYTLQFAAAGRSDSYGGFIDNVSIAAVPVPAGGLLLVGAIGGLAALRRRKAA